MGFGVAIPKIENEDMFENFCLDIIKANKDYENENRNGRRGQAQEGVDIFAREKTDRNWLGIQCKVKTKEGMNKKEIKEEVEKAKKFSPLLSNYIFYTTAKRDADIQSYVRSLSDENIENGLFNIDIKFWEDIEDLLNHEQYSDVRFKYFHDYYTHIEEDGYAFGKMISLEIGVKKPDTFYPLLIGKIYSKDKNKNAKVNSWKGLYFVNNLHNKKFATFRGNCFESDLEGTFVTQRDAYIITKFLNSISDLDEFLKKDVSDYEFILSEKEFYEFLKENNLIKKIEEEK